MKLLKPEEEKIVKQYIQGIRKLVPHASSEIIMFGSKAREESQKDSDIDILVVIDTKDRLIKRKIQDLCWDVMFDNNFKAFLAPVILYKSEYLQYKKWNSSFLYNINQDGIRL